GEKWTSFPAQSHLPLGIMSAMKYQASTARLKAGESWLLFSDGITEARNPAGEDFTIEKLQDALGHEKTAGRTLESIVSAWKAFVNSATHHDDASLLLLD